MYAPPSLSAYYLKVWCARTVPVCVSERVERVLGGGLRGRHVGDHAGARVSEERVAQDVRQLGLAVRRVLLLLVQAPDALLQLQSEITKMSGASRGADTDMLRCCALLQL